MSHSLKVVRDFVLTKMDKQGRQSFFCQMMHYFVLELQSASYIKNLKYMNIHHLCINRFTFHSDFCIKKFSVNPFRQKQIVLYIILLKQDATNKEMEQDQMKADFKEISRLSFSNGLVILLLSNTGNKLVWPVRVAFLRLFYRLRCKKKKKKKTADFKVQGVD